MRRPAAGRRQIAGVLAALLVALASVFLPAGPALAQEPTEICAAERKAADDVNAEIEAHNAKPHDFIVPRDAAAATAYDAEAAQLNTQRATVADALASCATVWATLTAGDLDSPVLKVKPSPEVLSRLEDARGKVPPGYRDPPTPPGQQRQIAPGSPLRPIWAALRQSSPAKQLRYLTDLNLQGKPRPQIGDPDPSLPGRVIGSRTAPGGQVVSAVQIDHIISLVEVVQMDGFAQLTPAEMYAVVNSPANLQWLSPAVNGGKSSRSVAYLDPVDPDFQREQVALENTVREKLQTAIRQFIANHH